MPENTNTQPTAVVETPSLTVRQIIAEDNGYAHVVVAQNVFELVNGFRPKLPYTTGRNAAGNGVRCFEFKDGAKLWARRDKESGKTIFVTSADVAKKNLRTLEEERSGEPALAFGF